MFSLQIVRKATGQAIFDTGLPGLVFSQQFIQLPVGSRALPCPGPAALQEPLRPGRARAAHLPARPGRVEGVAAVRQGQPAGRGTHLQVQPVRSPSKVGGGGHARYTVVEDDGSTHGVLFINSNAQEFETFPLPGVVYRTIGDLVAPWPRWPAGPAGVPGPRPRGRGEAAHRRRGQVPQAIRPGLSAGLECRRTGPSASTSAGNPMVP